MHLSRFSVFKTKEEGGAWWHYTADGEWSGKTAGGCPNNVETAQFNPQYVLSPTRPCTVFVAMRQREVRGRERADVTIGFKILNKGGKRVKRVFSGEQVAAGAYSELEEVSCEASLTPQAAFYTLFVSTFEPGIERSFSIDVFSDAPLDKTDGRKLRLIPESVPAA